jgi:hypothetical protein
VLIRLPARNLPGAVDRAVGSALAATLHGELRPVQALATRAHLLLDGASGALLATSPSLAGCARAGRRYWPAHVAVGALEVARAIAAPPEPARR